jgi:hypothetical protein
MPLKRSWEESFSCGNIPTKVQEEIDRESRNQRRPHRSLSRQRLSAFSTGNFKRIAIKIVEDSGVESLKLGEI